MEAGRERLLTPSKVTAWLDCPHYLALSARVDDGTMPRPEQRFGSFAELLLNKGLAHEQDCLAEYRRQERRILEVPAKAKGQTFASWVAETGNPLDGAHDVVYQMPFIHNGIRGVADFVVRVHDPDTGEVSNEPVDAKLTRVDALYFCLTVFTTTGFGDIAPDSQGARIAVSIQMASTLVLLGLGLRFLNLLINQRRQATAG